MIADPIQQRIDELFRQAVGMAPSERHIFLDGACRGEPMRIRAEVEQLLAADDYLQSTDRTFLKETPLKLAEFVLTKSLQSEPMSGRIGPYDLKRLLGEGGFGQVYLAKRVSDYQQFVAIKIAQRTSASDTLARFAQERQLLAELEHENIARIVGGGQTADGRPYFAMEYVEGQAITEYCNGQRLSIHDRLRLFQKVCAAVAYTHRYGVIHRDLKPSNILVREDGVPKLIDFGIAKLTDSIASHRRLATTRTGMLPLTLEYASPEQFCGQAVSTASDVYSLGVILYELLVGRRPYAVSGLSPTALERAICDDVPEAPSTALKRIAKADNHGSASGTEDRNPTRKRGTGKPDSYGPSLTRRVTVATAGNGEERLSVSDHSEPFSAAEAQKAAQMLAGDLDTIVQKALHKEPGRRYTSPEDLALDIQRYFDGRPVLARPDSKVYKAAKFIRRYRWAVAAACLFALLLVGAGTAISLALWEANQQQRVAAERLRHSERLAYNLHLGQVANISQRDPRRALELLEDEARFPPKLRDFTWGYYRRLNRTNHVRPDGDWGALRAAVFSPAGDTIAFGGRDGVVWLIDRSSIDVLAALEGHTDWINSLAFSPDGRFLVSGSDDHTIRLWDVESHVCRYVLRGHTDTVESVAFSSDGSAVASAGTDTTIRFWDTATGASLPARLQHDDMIGNIAYSPDGSLLAAAGRNDVVLWDIDRRAESRVFTEFRDTHDSPKAICFSHDGRRLAASGLENLFVWNLDQVESHVFQDRVKRPHVRRISSLQFSPDDRLIASAGYDGTIRVWDAADAKEILLLEGHEGFIHSIDFSPDGEALVSASDDGTVRIWRLSPQAEALVMEGHQGFTYAAAYSHDGQFVASAGEDHQIKIWDANSGALLRSQIAHDDLIRAIALSPQNGMLATASFDGTIRLWDCPSGSSMGKLLGHSDRVQTIAFSSDGKRLASGARDGVVKLWNVPSGDEIGEIVAHHQRVASLTFVPGGNLIATASHDGTVRLWNSETLSDIATFEQVNPVGSVAVTPDGQLLAAGTARRTAMGECEGTIEIWNINSEKMVCRLKGHTDEVFCLDFSPDGKTLASGSADRTARLWDVTTGQERAALPSHDSWVHWVGFAPDGQRLATVGAKIRIWESDPTSTNGEVVTERREHGGPSHETEIICERGHEPRLHKVLRGHKDYVVCVDAFAETNRIVTAGVDGRIIVWDASSFQPTSTFTSQGPVSRLACFPGCATIVTGADELQIWTPHSSLSGLTLRKHEAGVAYVAVSPEREYMAVSYADGLVEIWNIRQGRVEKERSFIPEQPCWMPLAFSPDNSQLAGGRADGAVEIRSTSTWSRRLVLSGHHDYVCSIAFSPNGRLLATGSRDLDRPLVIYDLEVGKRLFVLHGHTDSVTSLAFSPDGRRLASTAAGFDGTTRLWDVESGREIAKLPNELGVTETGTAFSPDGNLLFTSGPQGAVNVWELRLPFTRQGASASRIRE